MLGKCQMRKYKVSCGWGTIQNQRRVFARLKTRITLMAPTLGRKGPLKFGHQPHYQSSDSLSGAILIFGPSVARSDSRKNGLVFASLLLRSETR